MRPKPLMPTLIAMKNSKSVYCERTLFEPPSVSRKQCNDIIFCMVAALIHLHYLRRPQTRDPTDELVLETLNKRDFAIAATNFKLKLQKSGESLRSLG